MTEKEEKILYIGTSGGEDPERASMPFMMANAALAMDVKASIALQGNGVYLALKGYVDTVLPGGGFPPLKKLITDYLELGGKIKLCTPCVQGRNIAESDLIEGAELSAAGSLNLEALEANAVLVY